MARTYRALLETIAKTPAMLSRVMTRFMEETDDALTRIDAYIVGDISCTTLTTSGDVTVGDDLSVADDLTVGDDAAITGDLTAATSTTTGASAASIFKSNDGTKTAPGHTFTNDLDTGLYRIGVNNPAMSAGDTKVQDWTTAGTTVTGTATVTSDLTVDTDTLYVDAANNRVAIGTTTTVADTPLYVTSATPTAAQAIIMRSTHSSSAGLVQSQNSGGGAMQVLATGSGYTNFAGHENHGILRTSSAMGGMSIINGATVGNTTVTDMKFVTTASDGVTLTERGKFSGSTGKLVLASGLTVTAGGATVTAGDLVLSSGKATLSGVVETGDGTKTAPAHSFSGDADSGLYRIGANNPAMSAGDTKVQDWTTTGTNVTGTATVSGLLTASAALTVTTGALTVSSGNASVSGTLTCSTASPGLLTQEAWVAGTMGTGMSNYGAGFPNFQCRKLSTGLVVVTGLIKSTAAGIANGATVGVLPSGYRPSSVLIRVSYSSTAIATRYNIQADGAIVYLGATIGSQLDCNFDFSLMTDE